MPERYQSPTSRHDGPRGSIVVRADGAGIRPASRPDDQASDRQFFPTAIPVSLAFAAFSMSRIRDSRSCPSAFFNSFAHWRSVP